MSREVILTRGLSTIVDDEDYEYLSQWKWLAHGARRPYATRSTWDGKKKGRVAMHRDLMGLPPTGRVRIVDHVNGDTLDNRRSNLRICTVRDNVRNRKGRSGTSSQFKGVFWNTEYNAWRPAIIVNYKRCDIGTFADEVEAALAYDAAAQSFYGEFARFNLPERTADRSRMAEAIKQRLYVLYEKVEA